MRTLFTQQLEKITASVLQNILLVASSFRLHGKV
uniref:Uncharacterized protein n=1 Tax=Arundo donax TaxID=35708 RepID=A0A0A9AMQ2_ARUDO